MEIKDKEQYYYFDSVRICSVVDSIHDEANEMEDKFVDYQCSVCYQLSLDIQECKSCEHIFCNKCISSINSNPKLKDKCPNNCSPWNLDKPHRAIRNAIENIDFYCKNYSQGCRVKLRARNAYNHENMECDYTFEPCPNTQCGKLIQKKSLENHLKEECPYRLIICQTCELPYMVSEKSKHNCISSLKKELSEMKSQMTDMITKEQFELILQDYIQKSQQAIDEQKNQYEQEAEKQGNEKIPHDNDENLHKNQDQSQSKHKNPFSKLLSGAFKFLKNQHLKHEAERKQQSQMQNQSQMMQPNQLNAPQNNAFAPIHPPGIGNQLDNSSAGVPAFGNFNGIQQQLPPNHPHMFELNQPLMFESNQSQMSQPNQIQMPQPNQPQMFQPNQPQMFQSNYPSMFQPNYPPMFQSNQSQSNYMDNQIPFNSFRIQNLSGGGFNWGEILPQPPKENYSFGGQCDHSNLGLIKSGFGAMKMCQCSKQAQSEYYFCAFCNKYFCRNCKQ